MPDLPNPWQDLLFPLWRCIGRYASSANHNPEFSQTLPIEPQEDCHDRNHDSQFFLELG